MRTLSVALLFAVIATGCGTARSQQPSAAEQPIPGVLRVICEEDRTRVVTPRVRTHPDGVHFMYVNRAGMDQLWMRSVESPDLENHGGFLRKERQRDVASHGPGRMWVACFDKGDHPPYYEHDARYAEFEIVDVAGLWIPWQVACDDPESLERKRVQDIRTADEAEQWLRDHYDIPDDAERVRPGYPKTAWKGDPWVLVHNDATIVNFHVFREQPRKDVWRLTAEICT